VLQFLHTEGKSPIERPKRRKKKNNEMDLKIYVVMVWTGLNWLRIGSSRGLLWTRLEPSRSTNSGEFLDQVKESEWLSFMKLIALFRWHDLNFPAAGNSLTCRPRRHELTRNSCWRFLLRHSVFCRLRGAICNCGTVRASLDAVYLSVPIAELYRLQQSGRQEAPWRRICV
jgi:hypothetical protein